jgi:integrase
MSIFKTKKTGAVFQYDIRIEGNRFHGSTRCTSRREAERFEMIEREKAQAEIKAMKRARVSLAIEDVVERLWQAEAQYDAAPDATETNLARLVEYFGARTTLNQIDHMKAKEMVAWRRGHRVYRRGKLSREQKEALPLLTPATVNRSTIAVLQRLFRFAKAEGAIFDREPKWRELLLPEPVERVRELQDDEAAALVAAMRDDYLPFFAFVRATGLRQKECVTLQWSEVNFGTKQIVRIGKGGRRIVFPITASIRDILFPLQGLHDRYVFTYRAKYGNRKRDKIRGKRYPLTLSGTKAAWRTMRIRAGVQDFRFHDYRHDFGSKLLRQTGNLKLTQKAMNHADIKSTLRYAHVLDEDVASAVENMNMNYQVDYQTKVREAG